MSDMHVNHWPIAVIAFALMGPAAAQAAKPRFEMTPFVGYRTGGEFEVDNADGTTDSVDLDDDASFGLDLGLYRDANSFYELLYSRQEASVDSSIPDLSGIDVSTEYLHFGGTLLLDHETWYEPYLSFTIGATRLDPKSGGYDSETKFSASLGGGFRFPINERVSAVAGGRAYLTFIGSDTDLFCLSDANGLNCLLKSSGSTYLQFEAQLGLSVRF
jgi:hypothetical protein